MPPTLTRSTSVQSIRPEGRAVVVWGLASAVALALILWTGEVLEEPDTVDLVLRNDSARAVAVHVRGEEGAPFLPVATVDPDEERSVEQVIDQGGRWLLTFRVAGVDVGQQEVTGNELAAAGHRITIPASVDDTAGAEGIDPTP